MYEHMAIDGLGIKPQNSRVGMSHARTPAQAAEPENAPRPRAVLDFIPSPDSLATLIRSALASLSRGVYWDRGSILNIQA